MTTDQHHAAAAAASARSGGASSENSPGPGKVLKMYARSGTKVKFEN